MTIASACALISLLAALPLCAQSSGKVVSIQTIPQTLTLINRNDMRQVLVIGITEDGYRLDMTDRARYQLDSGLAKRSPEGFFVPLRSGKTTLSVSVGRLQARVPVTVKSMSSPPVSFVRDVQPILSRTGCNQGTCHGSAKGKNGFKLSLRGYDTEFDYHALISDIAGRRFNRARPEESLMLLKPTQGVAHQGGLIFEENSRYYSTLRSWIAEGVKSDTQKTSRANRLQVLPANPTMKMPGQKQRLIVLAHYPDGTSRDVTRESVFSSTVKDVATVSEEGIITSVRRGETAILIRYEGNYATNEVTVIGDRTGYRWVSQPQHNYVDRYIDAKLKRIQSIPSGICTDEEFIRRAYLDIVGIQPTPEQVRAFRSDKTPVRQKREKLIDMLLESGDYVDFWTNKWADLLSVNRKFHGERGTWKFRTWIARQIAENRSYQAFVREIITASGSSFEHPAAAYYRVARDPNTATENITQLFLGIRFSCNKCHDHPFERWTQNQYYQFAAHFSRIGYKPGVESGDETIYDRREGEVVHPRTNMAVTASFPYSFARRTADSENRREKLANWLTDARNPYFARSFVNRVWSYFLGRGIIDPVDDIRGSNPPVNPQLLDALTQDFIRSGWDVKHLIRTITRSRTYQASIKTNRWNADDQINFSHAVPRRLSAEQLMDSISRATGSTPRYPGVPEGFRAVQLPDTQVAPGGFLDLFGRPPREAPCECERSNTVSLGQTLYLINGPTIAEALISPEGRIAQLMKSDPTDERIIEEMFLAALCRFPTAQEMKKTLSVFRFDAKMLKETKEHLSGQNPSPTDSEIRNALRAEAAQDLLWALMNSPAFLFNR